MSISILFLIDSLQNGGTEKQLFELINHLDRDRFIPYICTLKSSGKILTELDATIIELNFCSFVNLSIYSVLKRLVSFIRNNDIDIVQTFFQDPFFLAALSKPFHKAKLVGSFRDLGFWRTRVESLKMRLAYPFFSGFIANSKAVKDHFVKIDGIHPDKIRVIYNGINLQAIPPLWDKKNKPAIVGIVANCNRKVKRVDDFIHAAALICQDMPNTHFMVVGDGHLRQQLEDLSTTLGLGERIDFVGNVPNPLDYINRFTVGVITSETEGFCNAILEYMACGVPVVTTDAGGNPELVTNDENGYLVAVGDIESIAQKVINLLRNLNIASDFRIKNLDRVKASLTVDRMIDGTQSFYETL
jgi:glycosyltransferase involved in cell wall biosynthesis